MRVDFYYNPELDVVGHQEHISIYTPFGEAIDNFCTTFGFVEDDWEFRWWHTDDRNMLVNKHYTPNNVLLHDTDVVEIYCFPVTGNN
jgi:hypothetical protein